MKTLTFGVAAVGVWLVLGSQSATPRPPDPLPEQDAVATHASLEPAALSTEEVVRTASIPPETETLTEVVRRYCVRCHNDTRLTGNVSLQDFAVEEAAENAETAEKMIRKLRAGMMPPPGMPRPSADTLLALVETLESNVDEAALAAPTLGVRRFQRLSQADYEHLIRDLLALEVDAGKWLPPDTYLGSFDNMADAQALSTTLLDSYLRAATEVSRLAVGNPTAVSSTTTYETPIELSQHAWEHVEGAPFGTRGGMVVTHDFPADGEYVFEATTLFGNGTAFEDLVVSVDSEPVAFLRLPHPGGGGDDFDGGEDRSNPLQTEPIFVRAGQREVSAAFVRRHDGPYDDRFTPPKWSFVGGEDSRSWADHGITALPHLETLVVTGPENLIGVSETESRQKIFTCRPTSAAEERPCAESILTELATQAYRRPVTEEDMAGLMNFYDQAAAEDGFEIGVRTGLQVILASPEFLFRLEREPASARPGERYRLSDVDLATRLSFFLWAAAPDEELLEVAASGRLSDPVVLEQQVERMLEDPRSETLATRFAHQWLRLQDVEKAWPEPFLYPDFSQQLADAMVRETELLFQYLVQEDRSLLELFDADYTFVNERLAQHYGIEGVSGVEFRRVEYPNDQRRGILGHGSMLTLTSMSARTSPVLRGKWVMEVLMGTPPPPPPPNVPDFDASPSAIEGRRLTTRERMELHRTNPVCASCHRFMDPIGLALDNFDAAGKWRIRENMMPLDTRGDFYDGTPISTPAELTEVLLKRPIPLVRNFTEKLLAYAIGRPVEYFDQPTIRTITRSAEANNYPISSLIMGVVKSDPFQMRQAQIIADADPRRAP